MITETQRMIGARFADWPSRFDSFMAERRAMPFAWGANDCCLFTCDAILAITGCDLAEGIRGTYDSALTAARVVADLGGIERIAETRTADFGFAELSRVLGARRGDVVLFDTADRGPALGICVGHMAAFVGPDGLGFVPLSDCRRAWRIA